MTSEADRNVLVDEEQRTGLMSDPKKILLSVMMLSVLASFLAGASPKGSKVAYLLSQRGQADCEVILAKERDSVLV